MLALIRKAHQPLWSKPIIKAFPSAETLDTCIDLYLRHFHPTFPIIQPTVLRDPTTAPVLLLAVATIGATYAKDDMRALAVGLNELVRRMITYIVRTTVRPSAGDADGRHAAGERSARQIRYRCDSGVPPADRLWPGMRFPRAVSPRRDRAMQLGHRGSPPASSQGLHLAGR